MAYVRSDLAGAEDGAGVTDPNPIVVSTGLPGFSLTVPITTPNRQKLALIAGGSIAFVAFLAGAIAAATLMRRSKK